MGPGAEYTHVVFEFGLPGVVDRQTFHERLMSILEAHAADGWELRGCFHDFGLHVHLIFGRQAQNGQESA